MNHYHYTTYARRPDLVEAARGVNGSVWPEFMFHDSVMHFPEPGQYIVPDALNPIEIDVQADRGRYIEPNVWMQHPVAEVDAALPGA